MQEEWYSRKEIAQLAECNLYSWEISSRHKNIKWRKIYTAQRIVVIMNNC